MIPEILIDQATLNDLVHERLWFDLDEVVFDRERGELRLHAGYRHKSPYDKKLIRVTGVTDVSIEDLARIGIYSLHLIEVAESTVTISSSFPLKIAVTVADESRVYVSELPADSRSMSSNRQSNDGWLSALVRPAARLLGRLFRGRGR